MRYALVVIAMAGCSAKAPAPAAYCESVVVTTLAGNGTRGHADGTGGPIGTTEFGDPLQIAVDATGTLFVADDGRVRFVAPDGTTTTQPDPQASLLFGYGVAVDTVGNLYVAETSWDRIRKIAPDGTLTVLAGNGMRGFVDGTGGADGTTEFNQPLMLAVDGAGNLYVTEMGNRVRKVAPDGTTTTLAGDGVTGFVDGSGGANGTAQFDNPWGLTIDTAGDLFVADSYNYSIRRIDPDGTTTTIAKNMLHQPSGIAIDDAGTLFVFEATNTIRRIDPDGTLTLVAGIQASGFADGVGCVAQFGGADVAQFSPVSLAAWHHELYVADIGNARIRKVQLP